MIDCGDQVMKIVDEEEREVVEAFIEELAIGEEGGLESSPI